VSRCSNNVAAATAHIRRAEVTARRGDLGDLAERCDSGELAGVDMRSVPL